MFTGDTLGQLTHVTSAATSDLFTPGVRVAFQAVAGTRYRISVDSLPSSGQARGTAQLQWNQNPPPNDDIEDAEVLEGATGSVEGTTAGAIGAPGDPACYGAVTGSVWYWWDAPLAGTATFATQGPGDQTMAAFAFPFDWGRLDSDDDSGPGNNPLVSFSVTAGNRYLIGVDPFADTGHAPFTLVWGYEPPSVSINDAARLEGNSGRSAMDFTIRLSGPSTTPITVRATTVNGTATTPSDYIGSSRDVTFEPGATAQTVSFEIVGNTTVEANETFTVNLAIFAGGATIGDGQAVGTIFTDDGAQCAGRYPTKTGSGTINGTAGDDVIVGSGSADTINGQGGNDVICGRGGNDIINGGAGEDVLVGEAGNDKLTGGLGNDLIFGGDGADTIPTAAIDGGDFIDGGAGIDLVNYTGRTAPLAIALDGAGGDGETNEDDNVTATIEKVTAGNGNDNILGSNLNNTILGGGGNDFLHGGFGGNDILRGQAGNDTSTSKTAPAATPPTAAAAPTPSHATPTTPSPPSRSETPIPFESGGRTVDHSRRDVLRAIAGGAGGIAGCGAIRTWPAMAADVGVAAAPPGALSVKDFARAGEPDDTLAIQQRRGRRCPGRAAPCSSPPGHTSSTEVSCQSATARRSTTASKRRAAFSGSVQAPEVRS